MITKKVFKLYAIVTGLLGFIIGMLVGGVTGGIVVSIFTLILLYMLCNTENISFFSTQRNKLFALELCFKREPGFNSIFKLLGATDEEILNALVSMKMNKLLNYKSSPDDDRCIDPEIIVLGTEGAENTDNDFLSFVYNKGRIIAKNGYYLNDSMLKDDKRLLIFIPIEIASKGHDYALLYMDRRSIMITSFKGDDLDRLNDNNPNTTEIDEKKLFYEGAVFYLDLRTLLEEKIEKSKDFMINSSSLLKDKNRFENINYYPESYIGKTFTLFKYEDLKIIGAYYE